jgi:hypothetical protein
MHITLIWMEKELKELYMFLITNALCFFVEKNI